MLRHPLDVVLSTYSNHLTHGFYCASAPETTARHYLLTLDLVEHYRAQMALRYLPVRYEDIVDDQETAVRRMLDFIAEGSTSAASIFIKTAVMREPPATRR